MANFTLQVFVLYLFQVLEVFEQHQLPKNLKIQFDFALNQLLSDVIPYSDPSLQQKNP